jgi:hypothetical protein
MQSDLDKREHPDMDLAHAPTRFGGPVNEEDFLADRQRFWFSFTKATTVCAGAIIVLLILMAVFLA